MAGIWQLIVVLLATSSTFTAAQPPSVQQVLTDLTSGRFQYVPGQVVVQYAPGTPNNIKAATAASVRGVRLAPVADNIEVLGSLVASISDVIRTLLAAPGSPVLLAEPNWIYRGSQMPTVDDPRWAETWGMQGDTTVPANQFGSQAGTVWGAAPSFAGANCQNVVVGVIDEGIQVNHPDLQANIWKNPGEAAGNRVDDDKNGFVDDVNGWDFANNDNSVYDGGLANTLPDLGLIATPKIDAHGTHVAGTIGGVGNNGQGVAGVCHKVKILSAKFLGTGGSGSLDNALRAINYVTALKAAFKRDKTKGANVVVTNNSWGGGGFSQFLLDAINAGCAQGIVFVAAAGNDNSNNDATPSYPASYQSACVISIAAIDRTGNLASFSNFGATSVHLGAPGVDVLSTVPASTYAGFSGTSMVAPHVSGAVALKAARLFLNGETSTFADAVKLKDAILKSARPTPSLAGKTITGGRLDIKKLMTV